MSMKRSVGRIAWMGLVASALTAAGCAPVATPPRSSAEGAAGVVASDADGASTTDVDDPNAVSVASSIKKVTVYSDRALVSREAGVKIGAGPTVFAFRALPGWVDDGSVRAATTAGRIVDVRVGRSYLARATEKSFRTAEAGARVLSDRILALDDELAVLEAESKQVEDIKAFSLERLHRDVAGGTPEAPGSHVVIPGTVGVTTYAAVVDFIATKMRDIAQRRRAVAAERAKLAPEVEASTKQLEDLRALTQLEETKVFVTVQGQGTGAIKEGAEAQLQLSYMLPGATWEAAHELRAAEGDAAATELTSFAVVTQVSGEDWDHAELTFSTQSSTASIRIPQLEALTLGTPATTQTIETQSASFKRAETAFRGQNRLWNKRAHSSSTTFEETYQTNLEVLQTTQSKTVQIFQSLQQRGTTAQFKASSATAVRADGRSVRVPIGRANLKAKKSIVAAPEQSLNAAQTLDMTNESGQALLPGSVALYQAGAFLGMTTVDFVADGEPFAMFLAGADQLKISRVLDKKRSAIVRKSRTQLQLAFVVTVENLSPKAMTLKLADRIPVSEDKDIVVSGVKIAPDVKPDSKGILQWPVTLQAKEKRTFEIAYQLEYPPSLVVEMKRNEAAAPAPAAAAPPGLLPTAPAPRKARDVRKDIELFEQLL